MVINVFLLLYLRKINVTLHVYLSPFDILYLIQFEHKPTHCTDERQKKLYTTFRAHSIQSTAPKLMNFAYNYAFVIFIKNMCMKNGLVARY